MATDVLVLVPIETPIANLADPRIRQTQGAILHGPLTQAFYDFEAYVGRELSLDRVGNRPRLGGQTWPPTRDHGGARFLGNRGTLPGRRSLASVTLATHLQRAGLTWRVLDPGIQEMRWWRQRLQQFRDDPPRAVAVCTTFIVCEPWLRLLLSMIRALLPTSKLLVGGYYYAVNIKQFLTLEADVLCVGEGETRLPRIVKALGSRDELAAIPGLYLRRPDGTLHYTGPAQQLDLNTLPRVDWDLVDRIEPHVDLRETAVATWVETQRGCPFKCEFCDFRTIQLPNVLDVDAAVEAILGAAVSPQGSLRLTDATATFPHGRWQAILRGLIQRGGSPVPLWCFGRVTDITPASAELMAQAGVQHIFIGQESGDQRILQAMRKGTNVKQVPPAIAALGRHGINATVAFIYGFPGEDDASIQATRAMILGLNDGCRERPVVLQYLLNVFAAFELATVSQSSELRGVDHIMGYDAAAFPPQRACEEALNTVIAVSRVPHAPLYMYTPGTYPSNWEEHYCFSPHRYEVFHWMKAVERGVAIFLERIVEGKRPNWSELAGLKQQVLSKHDRVSWLSATLSRFKAKIKSRFMKRLVREWSNEREGTVGRATRLLLAAAAYSDTRDARFAWQTFRLGSYPQCNVGHAEMTQDPANQRHLVQLADSLRAEALGPEHRRRQVREAQAIVQSSR